jgi:hypothetical protein
MHEDLGSAEQGRLEALVRAHLERVAADTAAALEAVRQGLRVPDMTGGG